ncbi:MFS transporter [Kitasatospora sp. NPDC002040]|uniref:MFS transporter n=1 Tax=Kitasatospora sp. NPDC002040 TaxID=3154661 RepID=UPI00332BB400
MKKQLPIAAGRSDFRKLWVAQTLSLGGSQISLIAFPLIAISSLEAETWQLGVLTAVERAPFLIFGLVAGVLVDRWYLPRVLMVADWVRAAAVGLVPVAASAGFLTIEWLCAVAVVVGTCTVFFDVAHQSVLPAIVNRNDLLGANRRLESSRSVVEMAGPGVAAALLKVLSAPFTLVVDAVSFALSAMILRSIRSVDPAPSRSHDPKPLRAELRAGLRFIRRSPFLRWNAIIAATWNLLLQALLAIFFVYLARDLQLGSTKIAIVVIEGSLGAILGVAAVGRINRVCGLGLGIVFATCLSGAGGMLLATANGASLWNLAVVGFGFMLICFGTTLFNVNVISIRQAITPSHLMGRTTAAMRFIAWGSMPIGALLGGLLGQAFGIRSTIAAVGAMLLLPAALTLVSPIRRIRGISDAAVKGVDSSEAIAAQVD